MTIGWIGAISALLGSLLTAIFSFLINKNQLKHQREQLKLERSIAFNKERLDKLLSRKEELFNLLQNICSGFSITQNYRIDIMDISSKEYDMHYEKMNQMALRAELLVNLYFPELIGEIREICGLTNLIWGQQQNYFGHVKETKQNRQMILDKIVQDSIKLNDKCSMIMKSLSSSNFYSEEKRSVECFH